jgi:hypothetical protein
VVQEDPVRAVVSLMILAQYLHIPVRLVHQWARWEKLAQKFALLRLHLAVAVAAEVIRILRQFVAASRVL